MKKFNLMFVLILFSLPLFAQEDSGNVNISFSISPPPIGVVDKYYEDESNTEPVKAIGFSYSNISSDIFNLSNISVDYSENYIKSKVGILYSNMSVFGGWGEINTGFDNSKTGTFDFGFLAGVNFQTKLFYEEKLKIFLAPGLDVSMTMMNYKIKNYPVINYNTWPWSISYKDVDCNTYITSILPKISFQINYKLTPEVEIIPFVTGVSNLSVVNVYIESEKFSADFSYISINFGLEAIFFGQYQLSSMVQMLNDASKTKIINISFSVPL